MPWHCNDVTLMFYGETFQYYCYVHRIEIYCVTAFWHVCHLSYLPSDVTAPSRYCYCTIAVNKGAVTAASRGSTIADLDLTTTRQPDPWISWSRLNHTLPCHTLIAVVWALLCATAPPVRLTVKVSAILNESVTAVNASRFSPVSPDMDE